MEKVFRLVNPATWSFAAAWKFVRKHWKWFLGAIVLIAATLFVIDRLTPDKIVTPSLPEPLKEERDEAVNDVKDTGQQVKDAVDTTQTNQNTHKQRIEGVIQRPSKTVDEAIDNWNNNR